ncbi:MULTISPECIES: DUF2141 domain-containing protein [Sphingomonas]|uniref:Uncharacterized protein (DUF2141 family) n=1 Tax=Sphingomonas kyeonggiensis TaxID=1268553 RepID=A0A7W7NRQ2_9SPHN|nr:DUF2141 domain-containing protein [Sphingomonas kyeonggiensis]MBB4838052.1 uncharacterized protein (DUF2141 family) [Sphingomonas kyeonggiensis]
MLLLGAGSPAAETGGPLEIEMTGLRSAKGVVRLCLVQDPGDFPDCRDGRGALKRTLPAANPRIRLEGLPVGDYAIAVIHDANGNSKLDTMLGIPREGFGFSRNPAIRFGPPRYKDARFTLGADAQRQQVRIRYLL